MHLVFVHAAGIDLIGWRYAAPPVGSFVGPATLRRGRRSFADRLFLGVAGVTVAGMLTIRPAGGGGQRAMIARRRRRRSPARRGTLAATA